MRLRIRISTLTLGLSLSVGCGDEVTDPVAPDLLQAEAGERVVATEQEVVGLTEVATDPFVVQLVRHMPHEQGSIALGALDRFSTELYRTPAHAYRELESSLGALDAPPAGADAELAYGVLGLYRSWSYATLYSTDSELEARPAPPDRP